MVSSDFRDDRQFEAVPDVHAPLEDDDTPKQSRWYGGKRRTFPEHPKGEYLKLLDSMIAESRAKREQQQKAA
jgi:hypothetical protein